jgi:TPR repeat protein
MVGENIIKTLLIAMILFTAGTSFAENNDYKRALSKAENYLGNRQYQEVIKLLQPYADNKHFIAHVYIGDAYRDMGQYPIAISSYKKGDKTHRSLTGLGLMYYYGQGVQKDLPQAINYFRGASESGGRMAKYILGNLYFKGEGVPQSREVALRYWRSSADLKYRPALQMLCEYSPPYDLMDSRLGLLCHQNGFGDW